MNVTWVHYPLHPNTPAEGITLEQLFAGRDLDLEAMYTRMKSLMDDEDLAYSKRSHTYNSRLAQELGKWADTQADGDAIHDALYKAYFVDGRDIGDVEILVEIAGDMGLSSAAARKVIDERTFEAAVDADWAKSRQYGVTGVPTFVAGGYAVVGAQAYETLAHLLSKVAGDSRSLS